MLAKINGNLSDLAKTIKVSRRSPCVFWQLQLVLSQKMLCFGCESSFSNICYTEIYYGLSVTLILIPVTHKIRNQEHKQCYRALMKPEQVWVWRTVHRKAVSENGSSKS